jgi:hypothetical protein
VNGGSTEARGLSARDLRALGWVSEQYAARIDQLAVLLAITGRAARATAERLVAARLAKRRWFLVDEPSWLWTTAAAERLVRTGFGPWRPNVGGLAHIAAVNDVRLHVEAHARDAEWVCERALARARRPSEHLPDAVVLAGGEQHAIEVELTSKPPRVLDAILDELSWRFDRVVYFTGPGVAPRLRRIAADGGYPKLVVRDLPATPAVIE